MVFFSISSSVLIPFSSLHRLTNYLSLTSCRLWGIRLFAPTHDVVFILPRLPLDFGSWSSHRRVLHQPVIRLYDDELAYITRGLVNSPTFAMRRCTSKSLDDLILVHPSSLSESDKSLFVYPTLYFLLVFACRLPSPFALPSFRVTPPSPTLTYGGLLFIRL